MKTSQGNKISSCLWFDDQGEEAAQFYVSLFDDASIVATTPYQVDTPSNKPIGSVMTVEFELEGQRFMALNGGSYFTPNPSVSFIVNCRTEEEVDRLWEQFSEGGTALMPLDSYPFSDKYGWIQDRYGISWQLILAEEEVPQRIMPSLLFVGEQAGKAEEAIQFYTSVFRDTSIRQIARYGAGQEPDEEGTVMFADFELEGQLLAAMDSAHEHNFQFNEGISLMVNCDTQEEIDYYWDQLSADPSAEQCGWLKDRFGVSWQIVPAAMDELFNSEDTARSKRAMEAMLQMKKLDIAALKQA